MKKRLILVSIIIGAGVLAFLLMSPKTDGSLVTKVSSHNDKSERLPLGDGKVSTVPQKGYIFGCNNRFFGGGAFRDGEWIYSDGTWDPSKKTVFVHGDVAWKDNKFEIRIDGDKRKLTGNGLPSHNTGIFPVRRDDEAFNYDRNPNSITQYTLTYALPLNPSVANTPSCIQGEVGVMKNGVPIFTGLDAGGRDAVAHEIQDKCNGHPEPQGHYHYHNLSQCIQENAGNGHSELVGYAFDGFGIFGKYGENGQKMTNQNLDECHGHTHEIMWDGKKVTMYHYHATDEYPYTAGCFRGTPVRRERPNRPPPFGFPF